MTSSSRRRLDRAIRITPTADRERRVPEWEGDFADASAAGGDAAAQVAKGAESVAWTLRRRQVEHVLTGSAGLGAAAAAWLGVGVVGIGAFLLGGPVLLLLVLSLAVIGFVLLNAGSPNRWSHRLLAAAVPIWLGCTGFVWWALGEQFDAADEMRPVTGAARWGGAVFAVGLAAFVVIVVAVSITIIRARHRGYPSS